MSDSYAEAGVSIEAADKAVELMKVWVGKATRPEVIGGLGGFAGLFDASALTSYTRPLLATSTDGVGTKVAVAQAMDVHDTIGFDLVGMVVDDLVVCGAEPLFMTDYIAVGSVAPERVAAIVTGVAEGCRRAGVALLGGETAEHPGLLAPDEYDIAGAGTGVVEADELLSALFPGGVSEHHRAHVADWWSEVLGGATAYTDQHGGYPTMIDHHRGLDISPAQRHRFASTMSLAADDAGLPDDPEFRAAIVGYLEWGTRLAAQNSRPGADDLVLDAPVPRWGWGVAPPYVG